MSDRLSVDWDRILPNVIHKAFNNSSAVVGYLDLADRTKDSDRISRFIGEARNGMTEIENVFFELGYLAGKYQFDMDSFPIDLSIMLEEKIALYDNLRSGNINKLILTEDHELIGLILSLFLRIASVNILSEQSGTVELSERRLSVKGNFIVPSSGQPIDGKWGYERELLLRLTDALNYKVTIDKGEISLEMADNGQT